MAALSTTVVVAGTGPVGLLTAISLGKANIPTILLEKHDKLLNTTRAMVYQPVVLSVLKDLGLLDRLKQISYWNETGILWRDIQGNKLGHLQFGTEEAVLLLGQARMAQFLLEEVKQYPSVDIRWGMEVVGIDQDTVATDDQTARPVRVMVHERTPNDDNDIIIETSYMIGTDGANSSVRRALCIPFEGFTWPGIRMIGADVFYDFSTKNEWNTEMQFLVHPEKWAIVCYAGEDKNGEPYGKAPPLWRVAYGEPNDLDFSPEKIIERANERVKDYALGKTDFEIPRAEPYRLHQRCARQAYKGRVFLAGDALHSNNPMGGLGLTTGILDAYTYGNAFVRVIKDKESPDLLTQCAESRLKAWQKTTNPTSTKNLKRLMSNKPEDAKEREEFFNRLNNDEKFSRLLRDEMQAMIPETFRRQGTTP